MAKKADILNVVEGLAQKIIEAISQETDDQREGVEMLTNIKLKGEGIIEQITVMRRYRELKNKPIYIFDSERDVFEEATKGQKIKIARHFLRKEGKI